MSEHPTIEVDGESVLVYEISTTDNVVNQVDLGLHETNHRGRNWIAIITPNRAKPGGLERNFLDRMRTTFYSTVGVRAGDYLEVGADYITTAGRRHRKRLYYRVLAVKANTWVIREADVPQDTNALPPFTPEAAAARKALADVQQDTSAA